MRLQIKIITGNKIQKVTEEYYFSQHTSVLKT